MVSKRQIQSFSLRAKCAKAFTLVEVMVGAVLFVVILMAVMGSLLTAYKLVLVARYQDRVMNALTSIADQFQNGPPYDKSKGALKAMYTVTSTTTDGTGLAWDTTRQGFTYPVDTPP